jgi:hypothetical protein
MSIRNAKRYGEFLYYLERPELIELYDSVVLDLFRSNSKFPHPDKKYCITTYSRNNFWMINFLRERIYVYGKFYDRSTREILEKSDTEVKSDLYNRYIEFCRDYPNFNLRQLNMACVYYIQPLIGISVDYKISLELDNSEPDLLIPRNFFSLIGYFRRVYRGFCEEVEKGLGGVRYFTGDIVKIVLAYSL